MTMTPATRSALLIALTAAAIGGPVGAQRPPQRALLYANDCPHEPPCPDTVWVAFERLPVYARLNDRSRRAFVVAPGERLRFHRAFVAVDRPGRLLVTRSGSHFTAGDTVYVLGYEGEGEYRLWHRGAVLESGALNPDSPGVQPLESSRFTWWAEVSAGPGRRGWLAMRNTATEGFSFAERVDTRPRPLPPERRKGSRPAG